LERGKKVCTHVAREGRNMKKKKNQEELVWGKGEGVE
jgi:hypothetical protein